MSMVSKSNGPTNLPRDMGTLGDNRVILHVEQELLALPDHPSSHQAFSFNIILDYLVLSQISLSQEPVPITTNVVSSNPVHGKVYSIQQTLCDKVCQ
jgi:hypothetical protein